MPPFEGFFQPFVSNMLEYADDITFSRGSPTFQFPRGVIAALKNGGDPFPLLLSCRVMVFPREEMLASYVHFFVERAKDQNGNRGEPGALTPLLIVKRLLQDYEYIDGERLFIIVPSGKHLIPLPQEPAVSLVILPGAATRGASYTARGTFTELTPGDISFDYGRALVNLFPQRDVVWKGTAETGHSLFGTLSLRHIERENPSHF